MTTTAAPSRLDRVRRAFADTTEFAISPLYRQLSRTVAADPALARLAAHATEGRYRGGHPALLFFGVIHYLLLGGAEHELAEYYPSIVGDRARPAATAGPALASFCAEHEARLVLLLRTQLVQTNDVQRALGLRLGLSAIAAEQPEPVHVIEVGASAGLNLGFGRYGYRLSGRSFGNRRGAVQIHADWYGERPMPDLDQTPPIASATGVDLFPVNVADHSSRRWLHALLWPESHRQRTLLAAAMSEIADARPRLLAGDAADVCPTLAAQLPAGAARVVYHSATRIHVPPDRLAGFDAALAACGEGGPLYVLSVEQPPRTDPRPAPDRFGVALNLRRPDGSAADLAIVDGHLRWVEWL